MIQNATERRLLTSSSTFLDVWMDAMYTRSFPYDDLYQKTRFKVLWFPLALLCKSVILGGSSKFLLILPHWSEPTRCKQQFQLLARDLWQILGQVLTKPSQNYDNIWALLKNLCDSMKNWLLHIGVPIMGDENPQYLGLYIPFLTKWGVECCSFEDEE